MTYPVLYLFPNSDLASMNPGKAMAHTAHGANAFVHTMKNIAAGVHKDHQPLDMQTLLSVFTKWEESTPQGFGTTIVLRAPWTKVLDAVDVLNKLPYINAGIINDPTYPYVADNELADLIPTTVDTAPRHAGASGKTVLYRSEDTCAWVFGMKDNIYIQTVLGQFSLHR